MSEFSLANSFKVYQSYKTLPSYGIMKENPRRILRNNTTSTINQKNS